MTYREELIQRRAAQVLIREAAEAQLLVLLGRSTKKYEYSNNETKHVSEIQDIDKLQGIINNATAIIESIDRRLRGGLIIHAKNIS